MTTERELKAQATVRPDGTGQLTMGSRLQLIQESDEVSARRAVMRAVIDYARGQDAPVQLEALDSRGAPAGVVVYPDGTAEAISDTAPIAAAAIPAPAWSPAPLPVPLNGSLTPSLPEGVEHTRIVTGGAHDGNLLRFSTGETVTVAGSGLIGRKPESDRPDDELVSIDDPTRSVSRIHLEFGHDDGQMWIEDRRSGNGSAIYRGRAEIVCVPGRRYAVLPGNRVEIGSQSFTVFNLDGRA